MKQIDLNEIPENVKAGRITMEQALHETVLFVERNGKIFGFTRRDEDLKSEVILQMLERGTETLEHYNSDYGSYFTYIFCYVKSLSHTCAKKSSRKTLQDFHNVSEYITDYDQHSEEYSAATFNPENKNSGKVPFSYSKKTPEDLEIACSCPEYKLSTDNIKQSKELDRIIKKFKGLKPKVAVKTIMVLALKSAFYITDKQIDIVASLCSVDKNQLQITIQQLKNELVDRKIHKEKIVMRRNSAYYQHQKYKNQILWIETEGNDKNQILKERLLKKYIKQTKNWINLNSKLEQGHVNVRPTNRAIALALGICERQVSYYIKYAENLELI